MCDLRRAQKMIRLVWILERRHGDRENPNGNKSV